MSGRLAILLVAMILGAACAVAHPIVREAGVRGRAVELVQQSDTRQEAADADRLLHRAEIEFRSGNLASANAGFEAVIARFPNSHASLVARQRILEMRAILRGTQPQATAPVPPPAPAVRAVERRLPPRSPPAGNEAFKTAVGDRVLFERGSARLSPADAVIVKAQAHWLAQRPGAGITLEGHADDGEESEVDQVLSLERAEAVEALLVKEGIDRGRIRIVAHGRSQTLALCDRRRESNRDESDRCAAHNRRVVSVVSPLAPDDQRRIAHDNARAPAEAQRRDADAETAETAPAVRRSKTVPQE